MSTGWFRLCKVSRLPGLSANVEYDQIMALRWRFINKRTGRQATTLIGEMAPFFQSQSLSRERQIVSILGKTAFN